MSTAFNTEHEYQLGMQHAARISDDQWAAFVASLKLLPKEEPPSAPKPQVEKVLDNEY